MSYWKGSLLTEPQPRSYFGCRLFFRLFTLRFSITVSSSNEKPRHYCYFLTTSTRGLKPPRLKGYLKTRAHPNYCCNFVDVSCVCQYLVTLTRSCCIAHLPLHDILRSMPAMTSQQDPARILRACFGGRSGPEHVCTHCIFTHTSEGTFYKGYSMDSSTVPYSRKLSRVKN